MRTLPVVALLVLAGTAVPAWADSPLTSIDFSKAYADEPAVKAAQSRNLERVFSFLSGGASNDRKLAVVHALGWHDDQATPFLAFLAQQKDRRVEDLTTADLEPSQLFALAALACQAHYLDLDPLVKGARDLRGKKPADLMKEASQLLPDDFAVQYAWALVRAQQKLTGEWCDVWKLPHDVERAFPSGKRNLRPGALEDAQGYLAGYEESCPGSKAAAKKNQEELNQVYTLSQLGTQVVVGAQGGVVAWDSGNATTPLAVHPGFICRGLTWKDAVWVGCEKDVVRWDGTAFTPFLQRKQRKVSEYYQPMLGPKGELWVRLGAQTFAFDERKQDFVPVKAPWASKSNTGPYDAVFFEGQPYTIDFLRGLGVGSTTIDLKSELYPGTDPRAFHVDGDGTLWVDDFESGLYHLERGRFVHVLGLDQKGCGVAVDHARQLRLLLHYTKGLVVQRPGKPDQLIDLRELENMRDLLYDAERGEAWIAGWGQFVRVRFSPDGATWTKQAFRTR
ncbi:MAG: hypothetical protein U0228_29880 [Myxococcaceae bacterium]